MFYPDILNAATCFCLEHGAMFQLLMPSHVWTLNY